MNKIAIESLSMDLFRVAIGYHRGSNKMAERFLGEALKRLSEIERVNIKPYFVQVLNKIPIILSDKDLGQRAENALTYSIICKNYAKKFIHN